MIHARCSVFAGLLLATSTLGAQAEHAMPPLDKLGTVHFPTSCSAAAQQQFDHAVALLHSFEFSRAIAGFTVTLKTDPTCAMGEWGIALSRWGNPMGVGIRSAPQLETGREDVERANTLGAKTDRERGYIGAVTQLYAYYEHRPQTERVGLYRDAMAALATKYPDDTEASIFYAIALTAAARPTDKTYADQLKAGAILEKLVLKQPDHPGLAHYIIHTYDVPPLAPRAIEAADRYSKIAPSAPHALHMPSHTFTRVGYWQKSIDANIASSALARSAGVMAEELHASDYMVYAYLQTAQDSAARRVLDALPAIAARFDPAAIGGAAPGSAGIFALAAIPARYALERGAWGDAAKLEPHPSRFPYTEAMTYYARAIGAGHIGDTSTVKAAIAELQPLRDRLQQAKEDYWAEQVRIQMVGATAWLAFARGHKVDAVAGMRAAASAEDKTEKSAVTPGPLSPAREQLGDMLLQMNEPAKALVEFEATLTKEPNRFRAVFGAAEAAKRAGDPAKARRYSAQLLKICERADKPDRPEMATVRRGG